jgi:KAP family P-loop domain
MLKMLMDADRPITRREDDRLGFTSVAERLGRAIVDQPAKDGLVFGIEGKWGSGKSTLINLTIEALKTHGDAAPEIIAFSPWLVGDRDELLRSLFDELATAVVKIDPIEAAVTEAYPDHPLWHRVRRWLARDGYRKLIQKERLRNSIGRKLKAFGSFAGTVGKLARAAGIPAAELVERGGDTATRLLGAPSVSKRKSELVDALRLLSRRIVVFVDDLDRLEPREASEVLRLIRAVADFPNVIYVLSYEPEVLAKTLTTAIQVDDGAAFLEKIVQVSFRVPRPEAFDLRRWFNAEVYKLFSGEFDATDEPQRQLKSRLAQAIDVQGGRYLQTPRDVVRVLNALRLHAVPVNDLIDIPDMVWLQLIRIGNPTFYDWIEEYLTEVAAIVTGATVSDRAAQAMADRLSQILAAENLDVDWSIMQLAETLPGLDTEEVGRPDQDRPRVFNNLGGEGINRFVTFKRLGSPHHYRYYYAFASPAGTLSDIQVQAFVETSERDPFDAIRILHDLTNEERPQGGTMAEVLIDRLIAWSDRIPVLAIPAIFASFASTMDDIALSTPAQDFGQYGAWRSGQRAVKLLLRRVTEEVRTASLRSLFVEGQSLGWLSSILRSEIFSHGHYGNHAEPENQWLLTAAEFNDILSVMLRRYRDTPPAELLRVPDLMSLLYAWRQGSGTEEPRAWVEAQSETDAGLLAFLSRARGWAASSEVGVYHPLKRHDLENFMNYDSAVRRLEAISSNTKASEGDRRLAKDLLIAVEQGKDK